MDYRLVIVIFCSLLSFVFSAAETALTTLGRLATDRLLAQEKKWKRLLKVWIFQPERILIMILVGNNVSNIIASSLMTLWAEDFYTGFVPYVIGLFTFVVIFCAEVLPKIFARQFAEELAPAALSFLYYASKPLYPLTWLLESSSRFVIWVLGLDLSKSVSSIRKINWP